MLHTAITVQTENDWMQLEGLLVKLVQGEAGRCSILKSNMLAKMRLAVLYDKYDFNEIGLKCDNLITVRLNMPEKLISVYLEDDKFEYDDSRKRKYDD
jgi:hypothetical protein